jgi:hypothetical protein
MKPINDILMKDLLMSAPSQPPYQQFFCQSCLSKFPISIMMCTFAIITESPTTCFFFSCFFFGSIRKKSLVIFLVVMMCKGMQKKVIFVAVIHKGTRSSQFF